MRNGLYTTYVQTEDRKVYDLGEREYPPTHDHKNNGTCPGCRVVNAWTALQTEPPEPFDITRYQAHE